MGNNEFKPFVVAVVGPTASGKTTFGIELAKEFDGEIISADSMQIYKGLDIATAKPTAEEMGDIPHHLISILELDEPFSVADYVKLAKQKIDKVTALGKLPIIVGGTGLYVSSLLNNIQFSESKSDEAYRAELYELARLHGANALHRKLIETDPAAAAEIHENNLVRVVRALEVCRLTGRKFSEVKAEAASHESDYRSFIIGLDANNRQVLYDRINKRVTDMAKCGLVEEARTVWENCELRTAANAIGYKELIEYFEGHRSIEECLDKIRQETRRYAKRQLTWFRRNATITWLNFDEIDEFAKKLENCKKTIAKMKKI